MEKVQELEWAEAQKIAISEDLVAAAKQQLQFLAEVDRHRQLYDGSALNRAIHRYKYCWLPLLAKQAKSQVSEGPLVVPLDCEWVWHCHKLNPLRYKNDCKELYGRILGSQNVVSSTQASCKKQTEEIWSRMYPCEPYELNLSTQISEDSGNNVLGAKKSTNYDLVSAVKRQSSFYYQVSRSHMSDDVYLEGAVARYKGFLHLIKRNQEKSISQFCVPTYDIDLIWHSHQLRPVSYCKDLVAILGRVLEHDDTDSDRTKGNKLDTGCLQTTKQWEETFGSRYWRAGAMYRGSVPSTLTINVSHLDNLSKVVGSNKYQSMLQIPRKMFSEVMLEIVDVINLPVGCEESLFATFSMKQPDMFFKGNRSISIFPKAKERQVAIFQSEPKGELVCQLMTNSSSVRYLARPGRVLGTASISLQDLMKPDSSLSYERWIELIPNSGTLSSQPINLRIALSFTPPVQAPFMLHLVKAHRQGKGWTCIVDDAGNEIMSLQMRDSIKVEAKYGYLFKKEAVGMTTSGETPILAEFLGAGWSLLNSTWRFQLQNKLNNVGQIFELTGRQKVVILPGRKLEYENGSCEKHKSAENMMTAVEFSAKHPYGRAVALFNLKSGFVQINEEWLVFPGILLAFLLANTLRKEGDFNLSANRESPRELDDALKQAMISKMKSDFDWETTGCENCYAVHAIGGTEYNTSNAECKVGDIMKSTTCGGCGGGRCGGGSCGGGCGGGGCGGGSCRGGCGGGGCNSGHETN